MNNKREFRYTYKLTKKCGISTILTTGWVTTAWHELERKKKARVLIIKTESRVSK